MEELEMVKEGKKGQLYLDFDALELISSKKFVQFVKNVLENVVSEVDKLELLHNISGIRVLIRYGGCLCVCVFDWGRDNHCNLQFFNRYDLLSMLNFIGDHNA